MSQFRDLLQFAHETADPNFSLSVPESAKQVIRELLGIVDEVRMLVMDTDGDYIDTDSFDGMAGEIQRVLLEGGALPGWTGPVSDKRFGNLPVPFPVEKKE